MVPLGVQILGVVVLCAAGWWAPGWLLVRRLRGWRADERVCAAVAASLLVLYLAGMGVFTAGVGAWAYWVIAGGCVAAAAWGWGDARRVLGMGSARRVVVFYLAMAAWGVVCAAVIRHYSGGLWAGDWMLHYRKVGMFLNGPPAEMAELRREFLDRPPMANVVAACWLGVTGYRFETFQLVLTLMNVLAVGPCVLFATRFVRRGGRRLVALGAVMVCLPTLWANATYTWTKLPATAYALLGIWLYLRSVEKGDRGRMLAAAACFGAGTLVHYVAVPYAALVLGHYLVLVWRSRAGRWRELALVAACCGGLVLTWFGWAAARYGVGNVFGAHPTVKHAGGGVGGELAMKMARNVVWTVVPHPMRIRYGVYEQVSAAGWVRDYAFLIYQSNVIFIVGSVGGVLAGWLVFRAVRGRGGSGVDWRAAAAMAVGVVGLSYVAGFRDVVFDLFARPAVYWTGVAGLGVLGGVIWPMVRERPRAGAEVWFWRGMVLLVPVMAGMAHDLPSDYGIGQIYFHPWALLGATLVAVRAAGMSAWVRWALAAGMAVDFAVGVWLHLWLEHRAFVSLPNGDLETGGLTRQAALNWAEKVGTGVSYLGDHLGGAGPVLLGVLAAGGVAAVWVIGRGEAGERRLA